MRRTFFKHAFGGTFYFNPDGTYGPDRTRMCWNTSAYNLHTVTIGWPIENPEEHHITGWHKTTLFIIWNPDSGMALYVDERRGGGHEGEPVFQPLDFSRPTLTIPRARTAAADTRARFDEVAAANRAADREQVD